MKPARTSVAEAYFAKQTDDKRALLPTKVTGSTIAKVNDTCGNLIHMTALDHRG